MSNLNKILFFILIMVLFTIGITISRKDTKDSSPLISFNPPSRSEVLFTSQENDEGDVKVSVKPKNLKVGQKPTFELVFDTHSVDLNFEITQISSLSDDKGIVYKASLWDGSEPGGHHRNGTLRFDFLLPNTKYIELTVKNVAGIAERKFKWNL